MKLKRISFHLLILKAKLHILLNKRKIKHNVAIISCDQWKNKIKDDILLKCTLEQMNVHVDIISWQDQTVDFKKYDALIVRTIWGYHRYWKEFTHWLKKMEKKHIKIMNSIAIIKENLDKEKQFSLLEKYKIKHIETKFIDFNDATKSVQELWNNEYSNYPKIVVKPTISESGNDTYILGDSTKKNSVKVEELSNFYQHTKGKLMVQPFIEEVSNGEYSLIFIDGVLLNAILRYPSIFTKQNSATYIEISTIEEALLKLSYQILKIPLYQEALYIRIDAIKKDDTYQIMEVELIDPDLFFSFIPNKKKQKEALQFFCKRTLKRIDKNQKSDKIKT